MQDKVAVLSDLNPVQIAKTGESGNVVFVPILYLDNKTPDNLQATILMPDGNTTTKTLPCDNRFALWAMTLDDTQTAGSGAVELIWRSNDGRVVAKSKTYEFLITQSLE